MTRLITPTMSFTEMKLPYPERDELWLATSTEEWKASYKQHYPSSQPRSRLSLAEHLRTLMSGTTSGQEGDTKHRDNMLLHGLWRLIWGYREVEDLLQIMQPDNGESSSLIPSRGKGLTRTLHNIRLDIELSSALRPLGVTTNSESRELDTSLIQELLNMVLHALTQYLQVFAGKDGVAAAQRVYPMLEEWAQSKCARRAVWNAGQIVRIAREKAEKSMSE